MWDFGDDPHNTHQVEQHNEIEDDLQYDSPILNAIIEKECTLDDSRVPPIAEKNSKRKFDRGAWF